MKLTWLGHSCFLLQQSTHNTTLLTDPFDASVGYPVPDVKTDVVTCSHGHFDHHYTDSLPSGYELIDTDGTFSCKDFSIKGIPCFHDDKEGALRGSNIIYVIEADGLKIAHMGDLGHFPTSTMEKELQDIDVMLMPVGGVFTLDGDQAAKVVNTLKPRITIPMHFKYPQLGFKLNDASAFLSHFEYKEIDSAEIELTKDNLSSFPSVVLLTYK